MTSAHYRIKFQYMGPRGAQQLADTIKSELEQFQYMGPRGAQHVWPAASAKQSCFNTWARVGPNRSATRRRP